MKKTIIATILFFSVFASSAYACSFPLFCLDDACTRFKSTSGGPVFVNGYRYTENMTTYDFIVQNINDEPMTVVIQPSSNIKNYVYGNSTVIPANSVNNLTISVWTAGLSKSGILDITYACPGFTYNIPLYFNFILLGREEFSPPNITCDPADLAASSGCYQGVDTQFFCEGNTVRFYGECTERCCEQHRGSDGVCSLDKQECLSISGLPTDKGDIALVCNKDDCGAERELYILLRLFGYKIDWTGYKSWTEEALSNYDIIVCADQSKACSISFNSPIYNAHTEKRVAFIEIPSKAGAKAANSFDYTTRLSTKYADGLMIKDHDDYITENVPDKFNAVKTNRVISMEGKYFAPSTQSIVNGNFSRNKQASSVFTVDEAVDHGRYAFLGWFYKADRYDLQASGIEIINRTLQWLSCGEDGVCEKSNDKKGKIAYSCYRESCSGNEENQIKWLRAQGYSVTAKSLTYWNSGANITGFDLFVCSNAYSCKILQGTPVYNEHFNGMGILELASSSKAYAGYYLNHFSATSLKSATANTLGYVSDDPILSGFVNTTVLIDKKRSVYGVETKYLIDAKDLAQSKPGYSSVFISETNGRYAFAGFAYNPNYLTDKGKELLARIVDWTIG